ncbi:hypothetical protein KKC06_06795 [Patescibacteria group bacterium]|nr:hypothetical protein [Patescibacteria group bacterium]
MEQVIARAKRLDTIAHSLREAEENLEVACGQLKYLQERNPDAPICADLPDYPTEVPDDVAYLRDVLSEWLVRLASDVSKLSGEQAYELEETPSILRAADGILRSAQGEN